MSDLAGLRVLVTGAGRGIGRATAERLVREGAAVAAIDLNSPDIDGAAAAKADVSDEREATRAVTFSIDALNGLDAVVNNAGIVLEKPLMETTAAEFDRVVAVNLRGVFVIGREAARHFLAEKRTAPARIVNLASELAHLGRVAYSPYCATKGGVISLTRSWARELAPHVLVNAVAPGPTDTPMLQSERQYAELKATAEGIPLARLGAVEEIAGAIAFLLGPDATYMTGSVLDVNGGTAMY